MPDPALTPLVPGPVSAAMLAELSTAVAALTARVEVLERRKHGPRDEDDVNVHRALVQAIGRLEVATDERVERFFARDVKRLSRSDTELRVALARADAGAVKALGKLLGRLADGGRPVDGCVVEQCGTRGSRAVWRLKVMLVL